MTLPAIATDVLAGRHAAVQLADNLIAAYWLHGRDDCTAFFLLNEAHKDLAALADAMGYTITPKVPTQ